MRLNVALNEAIDLIKVRVHQPVSLQIVSDDTIKVGYEVSVKIPLIGNKSKTINIDFTIDKVDDSTVYIHYSTGILGGDSVINVLLSFLPAVKDSKVVDRYDDGNIVVHLKKINQLRDMLEKIKINSISFGNDVIIIDFIPLV